MPPAQFRPAPWRVLENWSGGNCIRGTRNARLLWQLCGPSRCDVCGELGVEVLLRARMLLAKRASWMWRLVVEDYFVPLGSVVLGPCHGLIMASA